MTDGSRTAICSTADAIRRVVPRTTVIGLEPDLHRVDHPDLVAPGDPSGEHS